MLKDKALQQISKAKLIVDAEVKKRKELEAKLDSERKKNETLVKQSSETTIKMESKDKIILSLRARLEEKPKKKEYILVQAKSKKAVSGEKKKNADVDITDSDTINQEIVFKIQILSSGTPLSSNSPQFKGLKNVWEYKDGGLYKYTIGNKRDLQSASALQSEMNEKGFSGAFVVALQNGKRIPVRKALKLLK
jgi:N-acetylmuramoyl-L-alanine amidase